MKQVVGYWLWPIVILGFSMLMLWPGQQQSQENLSGSRADSASLQLFADQLSSRHFLNDGRFELAIRTDRATQLDGDSAIIMTKPRVQTASGFHIQANLATLATDTEQIRLSGDVITAREGNNPIRLITNSLTWDPQTGFIQTEDPVTMTTAILSMHATGMRIDSTSERIFFDAEVQSVYAPQ